MPDKNPKTMGKALRSLADPSQEAEELFYDPRSGLLGAAKQGEVVDDPDRVPATEMAREGFFA